MGTKQKSLQGRPSESTGLASAGTSRPKETAGQKTSLGSTSQGPMEFWAGRLRIIAETALASPTPIVIWGGPELILFGNHAYEALLGPYAGAIWSHIGPLVRDVLMGGGARRAAKVPVIFADDVSPQRYFEFSLGPIPGEGGEIEGVWATVDEITERVRQEKQVRTLDALAGLGECQEGSAAGICQRAAELITAADDDVSFVLVYLFDSLAMNWALAGAAGQGLNGAFAPPRVTTRNFLAEWPAGQVDNKRFVISLDNLADIAGRLVWAGRIWDEKQRHYVESAARSLARALKIGRAAASEWTLVERGLSESEEKFRNLADNMSQFAWMSDQQGRRFWYNRRWYEYTGATVEEMDGLGWQKVYHPDHIKRVLEHQQKCWETGEPWEDTFPIRGRDGQYRWFLSRAAPVRDANGRILRWCGTNTDITEQRKVEQDLRRANRDLEQFAYSASHDLQEPIRNIAIFGQILGLHYGEKLDEDGRRYLQFVTDGAHRMELLVKDLFDYAQTVSLAREPLAPVDANEVLGKALSNLTEAIRESSAQVVAAELPAVRMRAIHLQQLFQNLIGNALKYRSEAPPEVRISAERIWNGWRFAISDNGIGIDPRYKELIFGIFKRLHTQDKFSGTGIGLALCQRLVDGYGGRIWVESEEGKGATFLFTVPDSMQGND